MTTLVIDTGQNFVGVFCAEDDCYIPYRSGDIATAIQRIQTADEVVTYSGSDRGGWSDLRILGELAGMSCALPLREEQHTDMRSKCWSDRIWGKCLKDTYAKHFDDCPDFADTHEGSNQRDVYMTYKLWELWKQGKLKILDGHEI